VGGAGTLAQVAPPSRVCSSDAGHDEQALPRTHPVFEETKVTDTGRKGPWAGVGVGEAGPLGDGAGLGVSVGDGAGLPEGVGVVDAFGADAVVAPHAVAARISTATAAARILMTPSTP